MFGGGQNCTIQGLPIQYVVNAQSTITVYPPQGLQFEHMRFWEQGATCAMGYSDLVFNCNCQTPYVTTTGGTIITCLNYPHADQIWIHFNKCSTADETGTIMVHYP